MIIKAMLITMLSIALTSHASAEGRVIYWPNEVGSQKLSFLGFKAGLSTDLEFGSHGSMGVGAAFVNKDGFGLGLAYVDGVKLSSEINAWDGILLSNEEYGYIYHRSKIHPYKAAVFDFTRPDDLPNFVNYLQSNKYSAIQLPLVIVDGELDVRLVEGAGKAIRRFVFQNDWDGIGLYQTNIPMTLYDVSKELAALSKDSFDQDTDVIMAMNLPMGQNDLCMK